MAKKSLLIIAPRIPHPTKKGDQLRLYHQIKDLSAEFDIDLWYFGKKESEEHLASFCHNLLNIPQSKITFLLGVFYHFITKKPLQLAFYHLNSYKKYHEIINRKRYALIYVQLLRMFPFVNDIQGTPVVTDLMDALSAGLFRRIKSAPFYLKTLYRMEVRSLAKMERKVIKSSQACTIISQKDKNYINYQNDKVSVVKNGVDLSYFYPLKKERNYDLVFVGNMGYQPNHDAALFIIHHIAPQLPEYTFLIAGRNPSDTLGKKAGANVIISGALEDIRTAYWDAHLFIAPMFGGAGMQNKILEANACGLPVLCTPLASEPIFGINEEIALNLKKADEFVDQIKKLMKTESLKEKTLGIQTQKIGNEFSWQFQNNILMELLKNNAKDN